MIWGPPLLPGSVIFSTLGTTPEGGGGGKIPRKLITIIVIANVLLYVSLCVFNFGAINAHARHKYGCFDNREIAGEGMFFSMVPVVGTLIAVFATGFMEHGWTLRIGCGDDK